MNVDIWIRLLYQEIDKKSEVDLEIDKKLEVQCFLLFYMTMKVDYTDDMMKVD